nr:recombinase family protein [Streptomyces sp. JJ66]
MRDECGQLELKPLLYGYMRVLSQMSEEEVRGVHARMEAYAQREGYVLASVFHEYAPETQWAFTELVDVVKRSAAHRVVVPALRDLGLSVPLQNALIVHLECVGGAHVVGLDEL